MKTTDEINGWIIELEAELTDKVSVTTPQMEVGVHASIAVLKDAVGADEMTIHLEVNRLKVAMAELMPGSYDEIVASSATSTLEWVLQPSMVAA